MQGLVEQVDETYGMTRGPLWKHFPHHEHVEPVCENPTPTASQQSRARENNSQPRPQPARKHCLQDLLGKKDSSEITTTDVGSAQFAECIPAMTKKLLVAKRTVDYLCSNVPNELTNKEGTNFDLKEGLKAIQEALTTQAAMLPTYTISNKTKKGTTTRMPPSSVDEVTMDAEFLKSLEPPKEEKQGDQRYVDLTAEESEWVKSLINPKWKENDANNTEKYNKRAHCFSRNELVLIHRGAFLLPEHPNRWEVGQKHTVADLVASLKERDVALWEVHDAGDPIPRGGRKRVTNNEVKVVDDVGDDDATEKRRSKRSRNK